MPTDAVWIVVTIPQKDYERELTEFKKSAIKFENFLHVDSNKRESLQAEPTEKVLEECLKELQVSEAVWVSSKNNRFYHVYFTVDLYDNDATLQYLQSKGIGVRKETSVGYIPFGLFYCNEEDLEEENNNGINNEGDADNKADGTLHGFKRIQQDFLKSVTSRLTVMQVVEGVRSAAEITFDFVMYTIFAGFIAAAGLMNNSAVDIAAAMMIEPVMATVMAITFGLVVHDWRLLKTGLVSCCISLLICLFVGFCYGLIAFIWATDWHPPPDGIWPTPEMQVRGMWRTLWYGALQALAAGGAIAVTLLNNNQAALVGVAVASTFLPPFINTGLLWAFAAHVQMRGLSQDLRMINISGEAMLIKPAWAPDGAYKAQHYYDMRLECLCLGGVSMIYTAINVICMIFVAYLMLKIKEIVPLGRMEGNKRFFKEDIKVAREYNRKSMVLSADGSFGNQILGEWAEIAGLDPKELLGSKPEAQVTRLQTLKDIIEDAENDETYRSVTRSTVGRPEKNMLRRLTQATLPQNPRLSRNPALENDELWDVVKDFQYRDTRKSVSSNPSVKRRASKWTPDETINSRSNQSTLQSGSAEYSIQRGLRPTELAAAGRRKSSVFLRKCLQDKDHSPFSVWPSSGKPRGRSPSSRFKVNEIRRRVSTVPKVLPDGENTKF